MAGEGPQLSQINRDPLAQWLTHHGQAGLGGGGGSTVFPSQCLWMMS